MIYRYSLANPIVKEFSPNTKTITNANTNSNSTVDKIKDKAKNSNGYLMGSKDAQIIFIEYSDLNCTKCEETFKKLESLQKNNPDKVAIVFRHFVTNKDQYTLNETAECIGKVEGSESLWNFVSEVYGQSDADENLGSHNSQEKIIDNLLTTPDFDTESIKECLDRDLTTSIIEENTNMGKRAGLEEAPGVVLYDTNSNESYLLTPIPNETDLQILVNDRINNL